uniref:Uncharacterized protein n=1 Tax=Chenopodium quinoa TaxID=63459 RepID=A0A803KX33_CHEQI
MVSESSIVGVLPSKQTLQHSPRLLQDKELTTRLSPQINFSTPSTPSSSHSEPQISRKRCRFCESQPSFHATNQINLGLSDENSSIKRDVPFVSWPQNFTFQSHEVNKFVQGSETKQPSFFVKNHHEFPRKTSPSGIGMNLNNAGLFPLDGNNKGSDEEEVDSSVDFSKAIEDAISRIESLIPSLQKLVKTDQSSNQKSVDDLVMPNISSSANPLRKEKDLVATNELRLTDNLAVFGENMFFNQGSPMVRKGNSPDLSQVKWSRNIDSVGHGDGMRQQMLYQNGDFDPMRGEIKCSNVTHRLVDKPSGWVSAQSDDRMNGVELVKNSNVQSISQVPGPMFKAVFGRPESLEGKLSRNESFSSHASKHVQGLSLMPHQSYCGEAIKREATLRPCTHVPSAGSTSSMRHNRTSNARPPHQKWSQSHTSGRIAQEMGQSSKMIRSRDSFNRNSLIRKSIKGPLHSKVAPHDQISEETSWNSCTSSGSTTQQSGSPSSLSGSYELSGSDSYDSDESEPLHEKVSHSTRMREQPGYTDIITSGYNDTSSYSNSRDDYSDAKSSSQMSSERDESDARHARSFWKRLGEMFHHTKNANHRQKLKSEKPRKSEVKTLVKRKQPGHFYALVSGLMKHMRHSKKPKQVKNGFKGLGSGRHGGKKKGKKLLWWPKIHGGRGRVKVPNKGKARLGNYRTKSFAAAKMILKK